MNCQKCKNAAVKCYIGMHNETSYWYCRTCKIEIVEDRKADHANEELIHSYQHYDSDDNFDLLKEFERLVAEGGKDD